MSLSQQHLQQIRSILTNQISDNQGRIDYLLECIEGNVDCKHKHKQAGNKVMVDAFNADIRTDYKHVDRLKAKIAKLVSLQKAVKVESKLVAEAASKPERKIMYIDAADYVNAALKLSSPVATHIQPVPPMQDRIQLCAGFDPNDATMDIQIQPVPSIENLCVAVTDRTTGLRQDGFTQSKTYAKPSNPKDLIGSGKLPVHLWPTTATAMGCIGFLNGMLKYGRSNFRVMGIRASIYYDAAIRHLNAWFEGEECDPDDGVPHLAAALACIAIIVDAQAAGKFNDDRAFTGGYRELVESLTPHVARLKLMHDGKNPKHYTIADVGEVV